MLLAAMIAGWLLGLVMHEAGHAAAAAALGLAVQRITIGSGRLLASLRCSETILEWRAFPWAGSVHVYWLRESSRLRRAGYVAGGSVVNFFMLVLGNLVDDHSPLFDFSFGFVLAQLGLLGVTLVPSMGRLDGKMFPSDGLRLWRLLTGIEKRLPGAGLAYESLLGVHCPNGVPDVQRSKAAQRVLYQIAKGELADLTVQRAAWAALMRELARGNLKTWEEAWVLDHLVTSALTTGEPMLRSRYDGWSARAIVLAPQITTLSGSRGGVLVELGHYQAGKQLLQKVGDEAPLFDVFMSRGYEAIAEGAQGNSAAAASALVKASAAFAQLPRSVKNVAMMTRFESESTQQTVSLA